MKNFLKATNVLNSLKSIVKIKNKRPIKSI